MHIPDGFLSPAVWAPLDLAAAGSVALAARRAQSELEGAGDRRIPLLGVMGAFVFAAQMINFPMAAGSSGHLVGGALLAITLGPWAASIVMTAILILQAFIFQDGGIVVLGANICNMALAGVLAGYLPYLWWGRGRRRSAAIFLSGLASVAVSACLALAELRISGVPMPPRLLWVSLGLFVGGGLIEGAITVAAVRAIERLNPSWVRQPALPGRRAMAGLAIAAAMVIVAVGIASSAPDALERLLPGSRVAMTEWSWLRKSSAGLAAMMLIYAACAVVGRAVTGRKLARQRSA